PWRVRAAGPARGVLERPSMLKIPELAVRHGRGTPHDDELDARVAEYREQRREISRVGMRGHRVTWRGSAPSGRPTSVDSTAIARARARSAYGPHRRSPRGPPDRQP